MEIIIGFIILLISGYTAFDKVEKEDKVEYRKTVEDTSFNTFRAKNS